MPKTTIKEVAQLAGVSPSAVSFVLNNKPGVSAETRKRIQDIIEQVGYLPNPNSRRLIFQKTNNIAVLFKSNLSPLDQYFYSEINAVVLRECEARGYNLIFTSMHSENGRTDFPSVVKSYDVDGILFCGDLESTTLTDLERYEIPYVVIDSHSPSLRAVSVSADYAVAAKTAVEYLVGLGHRRIGYIGNSLVPDFDTQTLAGYHRVLDKHQLSAAPEWIQTEAVDELSGYACMRRILESEDRPSAVFCCADIYAIGALRAIKEAGLSVPEDISLVGIDDIVLSRYTDPMLTTVKIDKVEMGRIAVSLLMRKIAGEVVLGVSVPSDTLITRQSTRVAHF